MDEPRLGTVIRDGVKVSVVEPAPDAPEAAEAPKTVRLRLRPSWKGEPLREIDGTPVPQPGEGGALAVPAALGHLLTTHYGEMYAEDRTPALAGPTKTKRKE